MNAKSVLTATQAELSSEYAKGTAVADLNTNAFAQKIVDTADVDKDTYSFNIYVGGSSLANIKAVTDNHDHYTVKAVTYTEGSATVGDKTSGTTTIYDGTSWDSENSVPTSGVVLLITVSVKDGEITSPAKATAASNP